MKAEPAFQFPKDKKEDLSAALQKYLATELEIDIGDLQTDLLIDFLNEHIGKFYYNLGVMSAMTVIKEKTEDSVLLIKE